MAPTPASPALDSTFGCLFLAGIFSTALWGVACLQLYYYYEKYSKTDRQWLKIYTFLIWALDLIHQVLLLKSLYIYFVTEFGNFSFLSQEQREINYTGIITSIIDTMVQLFFVRRAWIISGRNRILTGILLTLVLAQLTVSLVYSGEIYNFTLLSQFASVLTTERILNAVTVFTDTFLALTLIYLLWRMRSGLGKTDTVIKRLITYTIGTGLITGLWAGMSFLSAEVRPTSFIYLLFDLVLPKLYFNCMLASLNARSSLREGLSGDSRGLSINLENLRSESTKTPIVFASRSYKTTNPRVVECQDESDEAHDSTKQDGHELAGSRTETNAVTTTISSAV